MSELWLPPEYRKPKAGENAAGIVEKVVYFENQKGHIIVAVVFNHPTPPGYVRKEVNTPHGISQLSKRIAEQNESRMALQDAKLQQDQERFTKLKVERLRQRAMESDCTQFEKDFIRNAIPYMEEQIRKQKRKVESFFHQEAFEAGGGR
jgi:hypothetical protein